LFPKLHLVLFINAYLGGLESVLCNIEKTKRKQVTENGTKVNG